MYGGVGERSPAHVRLAEVVGVIGMATDLGIGLPLEHAGRTCLLTMELGRRLGMSRAERADLYYLTLLRMLGCTAGSAEAAEYFGDEVAFGRATQHLDWGDMQSFTRWAQESFGAGREPAERQRMIEKLFSYSPEQHGASLAGHCEVAQMLASRLGSSDSVRAGLGYVFERFDGSGAPNGIRGTDLPLGVRVMVLCNEVEIHHRLKGEAAAVAMARDRSGTAFDPAVVEAFCADATAILSVVDVPALWERLLAADPEPGRVLDRSELIEAGSVMAEFADLKSTYLYGHSTGVAELIAAAAERSGASSEECTTLRFAALAHDLGRVTVSTAVWDKPGPLSDSEWEGVRLHAYYSERMLGKAAGFARAAEIVGMHHERVDGSGYHRGNFAAGQPAGARVLAACDAYVAMRAARPHRPALDPEHAASELRRLAENDRLDVRAVNDVLAAAGHVGPRMRRRWPAELTDREVDVLRCIARGLSIQDAAGDLHVAPKTVDFHLQNIYSKAGISTRAAAALFAVQNGLLDA